MWHLSTCLKFCMFFIFYLGFYILVQLAVLHLYCNKLMCVHMSRMSFERLFSVSFFFVISSTALRMCVVALVQIKLHAVLYMWLWFGCISICVQFFFCFFFFFVIFCSHLATAAHWILIGFTVCNRVYVSMAIVCYGIESDAGNRHVHVTQDFWHWTYTR